MHRYLLTPRWLALHAAVVAAVVGCLVLGWWQFEVYQESDERHDLRAMPAQPIADLVGGDGAVDHAIDRQAVATGHYVADQQLLVPGRVNADVLGSYVVTPLRTDDGLVVPVLRGWVDEPDEPGVQVPTGTVTVTGFLLPPETAEHATVRSDRPLEAGQAAYIAPDELAARGAPDTAEFAGYVLLQEQAPAATDQPQLLDVDVVAPIRDVSPWQNLSYWAQWWVFAGAALVFWASAVRSANRSRRAPVTERVRSRVPS